MRCTVSEQVQTLTGTAYTTCITCSVHPESAQTQHRLPNTLTFCLVKAAILNIDSHAFACFDPSQIQCFTTHIQHILLQ
jgi:hypothetical protein